MESTMTPFDIVRAAIPGADKSIADHVLFGMTPYPFAPITAREIYKAASRLKRATANGIRICDHCNDRIGEKYRYECDRCGDALVRATIEANSRALG
jgi:hypothetical protein